MYQKNETEYKNNQGDGLSLIIVDSYEYVLVL